MVIEQIKEDEIMETAHMIEHSIRHSSFADFYPLCSLDYVVEGLDYNGVKAKAEETHFYVMKERSRIIGCGGIGSYYGKITESILCAIFIAPEYHGRSYGKRLVQVLENDEYAKRSNRIEVHAAISAIPFYRKLGYRHKNERLIYEDGQIFLEKIL